jgi:hypothetical protein
LKLSAEDFSAPGNIRRLKRRAESVELREKSNLNRESPTSMTLKGSATPRVTVLDQPKWNNSDSQSVDRYETEEFFCACVRVVGGICIGVPERFLEVAMGCPLVSVT